jgi:hypothetical protein
VVFLLWISSAHAGPQALSTLCIGEKGVLAGMITENDSKSPMASVVVQVVELSGSPAMTAGTNDFSPEPLDHREVLDSSITDAKGRFEFTHLPSTRCQVRCYTPSGYIYDPHEIQIGARSAATNDEPVLLSFKIIPFKRRAWKYFTYNSGLVNDSIRRILIASDGLVWIASMGGVSKYDGRRFVNYTEENNLLNNHVWNILSESPSALWFATDKGATRLEGGRFQHFTAENGLIADEIHALCKTPDGAVWFCGVNGIARWHKGIFSTFSVKDGLPSNFVHKTAASPDGDIWVETVAGLARYDGMKFECVTSTLGRIDTAAPCWLRTVRFGSVLAKGPGGITHPLARARRRLLISRRATVWSMMKSLMSSPERTADLVCHRGRSLLLRWH